MPAPIGPIRDVIPLEQASLSHSRDKSGEFGSLIEEAVSQVEKSRAVAAEKTQRLLSGQPEELHAVVLAAQRAQLEFEFFLEVRNKVVQAYQEIMRMQV